MNVVSALTLSKEKGVDVLDAEILLATILSVQRSFILAHPEEILTSEQEKEFLKLLERRASHEPLAYLTGAKEFYDLTFFVNKHVLVPRPETEGIIEYIFAKVEKSKPLHILDVGTGSGALAVTLAKHLPESEVVASDISEKVLDVARSNAKEQGTKNITFVKSKLLEKVLAPRPFDVVVANLPYLDEAWQKDLSTSKEPNIALYAGENGLHLYRLLLEELPLFIHPKSFGIFEADPRNVEELKVLVEKTLQHHQVEIITDAASRPRFVAFEKK